MNVFAVTPGETSSAGLDLLSLCTEREREMRWVRFFSYGNTVVNIGVKTLRLIHNVAYHCHTVRPKGGMKRYLKTRQA